MLRRLDENLWVAERPLPLIVGDIGTRMTVIRLRDGALFLHSPVKLDAATRSDLDALGSVRHVVAPNKVHHFFIGDYRAYPAAQLYAAPGLPEKRPDLKFDVVLDDAAPDEWAGQIDQLLFSGADYINELVFFHRASRSLILTDLAFNVRGRGQGRARLFYLLAGAAGRFGPHRLVRTMIRNRSRAHAALQRMLQWDFDRVIVAHGEILEGGGRDAMRAAFQFLL